RCRVVPEDRALAYARQGAGRHAGDVVGHAGRQGGAGGRCRRRGRRVHRLDEDEDRNDDDDPEHGAAGDEHAPALLGLPLGRALSVVFLTRFLLPVPRPLALSPTHRNALAAAPAAVYRRALPGLAVPGPAVAACPGYRRRTVAGVLTLSAAIFRMTRPCGPTGLR